MERSPRVENGVDSHRFLIGEEIEWYARLDATPCCQAHQFLARGAEFQSSMPGPLRLKARSDSEVHTLIRDCSHADIQVAYSSLI